MATSGRGGDGSLLHVQRLTLAHITRVPDWHPEHLTFSPFPVHAWVVRHAAGVTVVDTGVGFGHALIDDWYGPSVVPLPDALAAAGVDARDVTEIVLSHLHFDHCGQHRSLDAPVVVQQAELNAAAGGGYTIDEWAAIEPSRLRAVDGDEEIAPGVRVITTPGHTPGHQSVVVEDDVGTRAVLGAQCAFRIDEVDTGEPAAANLHDPTWIAPARESLARVRSLRPQWVELSHDPRRLTLSTD